MSLPVNGGQSGIGLPHSTTLARNSGVPLRPRGRGVRQPYAAFIVSTLADFPFIGPMLLFFGVHVLPTSSPTIYKRPHMEHAVTHFASQE